MFPSEMKTFDIRLEVIDVVTDTSEIRFVFRLKKLHSVSFLEDHVIMSALFSADLTL